MGRRMLPRFRRANARTTTNVPHMDDTQARAYRAYRVMAIMGSMVLVLTFDHVLAMTARRQYEHVRAWRSGREHAMLAGR